MNADYKSIEKVFDDKVGNYRQFLTSDKRILKLVKQSLSQPSLNIGNDDFKITLIDSNFISENENIISKQLTKSRRNEKYSIIKKRFKEWMMLANEFEKTIEYYDKNNSISNEQSNRIDLLRLKITYLLIEIKTCLDLNINDIATTDIEKYCEAIAFDINNDKYETLSIDKHIDEENIKILNYKLKI